MILGDAPPPIPFLPDTEFPAQGLEGTSAAPVLAVGFDGAFLLAWEQRGDGEADIVFRRREPGTEGIPGRTRTRSDQVRWVEPAQRLDTDPPGASRSIEPRIAAGPNGLVVVAWQENRGGADHIRVNRSTDGGRSFGDHDVAPDSLGRASSPAPGLATMPALAVDDDGRAYVAWEDRRSGERDIYFARSLDGGATWQAPLRVDSDSAGTGISYHPQIVAWAGGTILVCWWDERDGLSDVYVRRSTDAGASWSDAETRLDAGEPGRSPSHEVRVEQRGDLVTLTWVEGREAPLPSKHSRARRVASRTSKDRGASWRALGSQMQIIAPQTTATSEVGVSLRVHVAHGVLLASWHRR